MDNSKNNLIYEIKQRQKLIIKKKHTNEYIVSNFMLPATLLFCFFIFFQVKLFICIIQNRNCVQCVYEVTSVSLQTITLQIEIEKNVGRT